MILSSDNIDAVTIKTSKDIRPAAEALQQIVADLLDMRICVCHNIASKQPMVDKDGNMLATEVFGWTDPHERGWQNTPLEMNSPLPSACRYESEPFWCNGRGFYTRQPNRHLMELDISDFYERTLIASAIIVPVHLPFCQIGLARLTPRDSQKDDLSAEYEAYGDEVAPYVRAFVSSYVKVMCPSRWLPPGAGLSKREVECLRWAAVGKTDAEISMIIRRSRATVRFHINNASIKLDAVNRSQTVFKATQLGYLGMPLDVPVMETQRDVTAL